MSVFAVQMIEYNPSAGAKLRNYVLSGVARFKAGVAMRGMPYRPSAIVPLDTPDRPVNAGGKLVVPLWEFLTGKDKRTDAYFVHQPGTPGLPVFRALRAERIEDLVAAAAAHAQARRQAGLEGVAAPVVGMASPATSPRDAKVPSLDQILAERQAAGAKKEAEAEPEAFDLERLIDDATNRRRTSKLLLAALEAARATLTDGDLTALVLRTTGRVREWAASEQDARAAATR